MCFRIRAIVGVWVACLLPAPLMSQPPIPASHTMSESGGGYSNVLHAPGSVSPYANGCTDCHGPYLGGGSAQSCFNCHWDYGLSGGSARPKDWTIPNFSPNTVPNNIDHDKRKDGYYHVDNGREELDQPFTYHCTDCHGPQLYGGIAPSCYSCHDDKWDDPIHTATAPVRNDPPINHSVLMGQSGVPHKPGYDTPFDPVPAGTYACSDCHGPNLNDGFATSCTNCHHRGTYGGIDHGFLPTGSRQQPQKYCVLCHGPDLTGDMGPSCFQCHAQVWPAPPPVNGKPIADPGGPYSGSPGQAIVFDGSASVDPNGTIVSYAWDFGEGTTATGASPTHAYADTGAPERYTVRLTVTDNDGDTDAATTSVAMGWTTALEPPVRQNVGMLDVGASTLVEADCRACHADGVPDRHHALYGTDRGGATPPYPDPAGGANWTCINCHSDTFVAERDCLVCHTTSPHHSTAAAQSNDCVSCHGDVVDNITDGHYIPSYAPSLVTPSPSGGDGLPRNSRGAGAGACDYCHDDDGLTPPVILATEQLHHDTGLDCSLCHDVHGAAPIRTCEGCHGPESLHSVQADSPNAGNIGVLVVGGEDAGYGHVGRDAGSGDSDCWGCHGFQIASAPGLGAVVPTVEDADVKVVSAGQRTAIALTGSSFANITDGTRYQSTVLLTGSGGFTLNLSPDRLQDGSLTVTIPADVPAGNYRLQAVKAGLVSNRLVISVRPEARIKRAVSTWRGMVVINGSGFGGYAAGSGTKVTASAKSRRRRFRSATVQEARILSWSDRRIVAAFRQRPYRITVHSIFGSPSAPVGRRALPSHK